MIGTRTMPSRILLLASVALPAVALAADSVQVKPGRWVETAIPTSILVNGQAQPISPSETTVKKRCLSAAEGADPRLYFGTTGRKALCTPPSRTVAAGEVAIANHCDKDPASPDSQARDLSITGTYGAQRYAAKAVMTTKFGDAPIEVHLAVTGQFDGQCKGDEDPIAAPAK